MVGAALRHPSTPLRAASKTGSRALPSRGFPGGIDMAESSQRQLKIKGNVKGNGQECPFHTGKGNIKSNVKGSGRGRPLYIGLGIK